MALKIEKGGWIFIFLVGVALVGYSLYRYGVLDLSKWLGSSGRHGAAVTSVDTTKPLVLPASEASETNTVRVRVNIWVGCAAGLVANGGLDTAPDSIYDKEGL